MKTFVIPPTPHLATLGIKGTMGVFCLAHLMRQPGYSNFFVRQRFENKFILLDNGAAENSLVSVSELVNMVNFLNPDEVVAPDVLYNGAKTLEKLDQFCEQLEKHNLTHVSILGCPQGKHIGEWLMCYESMLENPLVKTIGLSKFSVTKCFLPTSSIHIDEHIGEARNNCVSMLESYGKILKPLHLLGMGNPREYLFYMTRSAYTQNMLRSTDSCYAVLAATHNVQFSEDYLVPGVFKRFPSTESFFSQELSQEAFNLAINNIDFVNNLTNQINL